MKRWQKLGMCLVIFVVLLLIINFTQLRSYCSLEAIQQNSEWLCDLINDYYPIAILLFMLLYATCLACSIPSVGPLSIAAGYFFGFWWGVLYSMIASLIGASISFYFLRKMGTQIRKQQDEYHMNVLKDQLDRFGHLYLLVLHFLIMVPFIVINSLAVLANISWPTFLWVTTVGMLPGVLIYVYAGKELTTIHSMKDLFSWPVILALLLLIVVAVLPIILNKKRRKKK